MADANQSADDAIRAEVYGRYVQLKDWTSPFAFTPDQAEAFAGEVGTEDLAGRQVLEIGFGEGGFLAWAMGKGAQVAGSEINQACIAEAARRGIEVLPADLKEAAAGNPERFDIIVAFDVFEHLSLRQVVEALGSCAAMLKPGGTLLLRFPNAQSPFGQAPQYADVTHITALSGERLKQLTEGSALRLVAVRPNHRVYGSSKGRKVVRAIRYLLQDIFEAFLRFVYVMDIPLAPVVTAVLQKPLPQSERVGAADEASDQS